MPDLTRRRFISGGASLGALTLLTGCDVTDSFSAEEMLKQVSKFNDGVQALMFNPNAHGADFSGKRHHKAVPVQRLLQPRRRAGSRGKTWKLEVRGLVENKKSWTLEELYQLPQVKQVTRHICVEGWSAIGSWTGAPLSDFLKVIGADTRAKYVWFQCADKDGYNSPLDMQDRAACADPDDLQVRRRDPAACLRLSDEDPCADQARLQEPEIRDVDGSHQRLQGRLLGRPGV